MKEKLIPTANVYKVGKYSNETTQLLSICNWFTHLDVTLGELTFRSTSFRPKLDFVFQLNTFCKLFYAEISEIEYAIIMK